MRKFNDIRYLPLRPKRGSLHEKVGTADWVLFVLLFLYGLLIIYPFYNAFLLSISPKSVIDDPNRTFLLYPKGVTWTNYNNVFHESQIWSGLKITLILLFVGTAYQLFFTVITGYALSRRKWVGKNFVMNMILVTMFFGGGLIPYMSLIYNLNMYNSLAVLIIPGAIDTYNMLLMRNYFASLPPDLEESAKIDGANDLQIFYKVYLPMSLPMLATIGLFFAVGNWNSWYNAMLFISDKDLRPLQRVFMQLTTDATGGNATTYGKEVVDYTREGPQMAFIFFTILPMLCFYPFLQKFFVKGLVVGALKG